MAKQPAPLKNFEDEILVACAACQLIYPNHIMEWCQLPWRTGAICPTCMDVWEGKVKK
jgi:hypothetical protein